ncbi:MAG TPA: hypothetical protein VLK88_07790 [Gemmatimonadales bacterium]|nr:hypothetical protein [Gemmatimonadales bacterium]
MALALALAPVLLGTPGFTLFGAGFLLFAAVRADPSRRNYLPALMHEF